MYYCVESLDEPKLKDNLLEMDADFESEDGRNIKGKLRIGFTSHDDIIIRLEPWGRDLKKSKSSPVSYSLQDMDDDLIKSGESYEIEKNGTRVYVSEDKIEVSNNKSEVELPLASTKDLKNNLSTNGFGFTTEEFNNNPEKVNQTNINIRMSTDEKVYGGGERFKRLNHTGSDIKVQVTQGAGGKTDKTYKSAPRFVSSEGYGYSINTYNTVEASFGTNSPEITEIRSEGSSMEVLLTLGSSTKECLSNLYQYEPKNSNPPMWSYGFWSSRNTYESWDQVMDIANEYRKRDVPCDVIHLDPAWLGSYEEHSFSWSDPFSKARKYINKLHDMGFKISIWVYPYIPVSSPMYKETDESYFVNDLNGNTFIFKDNVKLVAVDFTNPDAYEWWSNELSDVISDGVDVIKSDFGEYITEDTVFHNGLTGEEMRNAYPDIYQKACASAFEKADKEPLLWSRSGWLGQNGDSIHWNGDAESDWEGYRSTIRSGLNAAMSSYSFWSSDVGGYKRDPSDKLYGEWMKSSAFGSSHIRAHGKSPREPWEYPDTYEDSKRALTERYDLIPYFYSYGQVAEEEGIPIMRPQFLVNQDTDIRNQNSKYFVGDHMLVAPYMTSDRSRSVYLPRDSDWFSYWDETEFSGGQEVSLSYDNCMMPIFVRKGAGIPIFTDDVQYIEDDYNVDVKVYGVSDSEVTTPYYDGQNLSDIVVMPDGSVKLSNGNLTNVISNVDFI